MSFELLCRQNGWSQPGQEFAPVYTAGFDGDKRLPVGMDVIAHERNDLNGRTWFEFSFGVGDKEVFRLSEFEMGFFVRKYLETVL